MKSKDIIKMVEKNGWQLVRISKSSHHQFKHPEKKGLVTIPHPKKDLSKGLVERIKKDAGLK